MRDLATRLREIVRQQPGTAPPVRELTYVPDLATDGIEAVDDAAARLGGTLHRVGRSACVVVDRRSGSDDWHGRQRVSSLALDRDAPIGLFDPRASAHPDWADRIVFFDIETTGLSGGAGTLAFLAGCGWFDDGDFLVRQFFLVGPAGEPALLDALTGIFQSASLLVTYNGRSFDVPTMDTRWAFHRSEAPTTAVPHFDMLPPARKLWGRREDQDLGGRCPKRLGETTPEVLPSCTLTALERSVLGVHRQGDVPGLEIPSRYFRFLRTGNPAAIEGVFAHNRHDLLSLAALTAHAVSLAREGPDACREASEQEGLGRLYENAGDCDRATYAYERAAATGTVEVRRQALSRLALLLRRQARHAEAAAAWQGVLELAAGDNGALTPLDRRAALALAIHHEHRARDLTVAKQYADTLRAETSGRSRQDAEYRVGRLERKMKSRAERPLW
ncbi:MAG TPA: ribonuclease H-like domain-containing protein [Vicinamibacterales bacterium]|nr:ribonuclease H-like domain-containing protein [Vicinamibacterales bacterium]